MFALGKTTLALCSSMRIERVLTAPLLRSSLHDALAGASHATQTVRIKRLSG